MRGRRAGSAVTRAMRARDVAASIAPLEGAPLGSYWRGSHRLAAHFGVNFITFPIPGVCDVSCVVQYTLVSSTAIP